MSTKLTAKEKFNALSNATHIFALKEEGTKFKLLDVINGEDSTKAVIMLETGEIGGLFTDSKSAKSALNDVKNVFGDDQPMITVHVKKTNKGQSVYYIEVE